MVNKKISLTDAILFTLEKGVEGGELFFESMAEFRREIYNGVYSIHQGPKYGPYLYLAIKRLRQRKLLEQENPKNKDIDKIVFRLTEEGKRFLLFKKADSDIDWDGKWRMVIFDIPESKRVVRDILRNRLKKWGFQKWQKSVWVCKRDLTDELRKLTKELEIDDWVLVVESDNVGK